MCQINKFGAILPAAVHMATTTKIAANGAERTGKTYSDKCLRVRDNSARNDSAMQKTSPIDGRHVSR